MCWALYKLREGTQPGYTSLNVGKFPKEVIVLWVEVTEKLVGFPSWWGGGVVRPRQGQAAGAKDREAKRTLDRFRQWHPSSSV